MEASAFRDLRGQIMASKSALEKGFESYDADNTGEII